MNRWKQLSIFGSIAAAAAAFFLARKFSCKLLFPDCATCSKLASRGWVLALQVHLHDVHGLHLDEAITEARTIYSAFLKARRA